MNKKHTTGYRGMLRDRLPATVNLALKWCEAKTKWIDLVYNQSIKFCTNKELRDSQCRHILGISSTKRGFEFHDTIEWDKLSEEDKTYWKWAEEWVNWFTKNYISIEEIYKTLKVKNKSNLEIMEEIEMKFYPTLENSEKLSEILLEHITKTI